MNFCGSCGAKLGTFKETERAGYAVISEIQCDNCGAIWIEEWHELDQQSVYYRDYEREQDEQEIEDHELRSNEFAGDELLDMEMEDRIGGTGLED